jgi:hypothetical protein
MSGVTYHMDQHTYLTQAQRYAMKQSRYVIYCRVGENVPWRKESDVRSSVDRRLLE